MFQAIRKDIIVTERNDLDTECEIIWTQCQHKGTKTKSILLSSYYRPHVSDENSLHELQASLFEMGNSINSNDVVLAGDFNAPNINWVNNEMNGNVATSEKLLDIL